MGIIQWIKYVTILLIIVKIFTSADVTLDTTLFTTFNNKNWYLLIYFFSCYSHHHCYQWPDCHHILSPYYLQALGQSLELFISHIYNNSEWDELWSVLCSWGNWDTDNLNNAPIVSWLIRTGAGLETQVCQIQGPLSSFFLIMTSSPGPIAQLL